MPRFRLVSQFARFCHEYPSGHEVISVTLPFILSQLVYIMIADDCRKFCQTFSSALWHEPGSGDLPTSHVSCIYTLITPSCWPYCTFDTGSSDALACVEACGRNILYMIRSWMSVNKLTINDQKTDFFTILLPLSSSSVILVSRTIFLIIKESNGACYFV